MCIRDSGKLHADESVKAHAAGAEERVVVDDTIIQISNLALVDDLYAFLQHLRHGL